MFLLCYGTAIKKMQRSLDDNTTVLEPFSDHGFEFKLMALVQGKVMEIPLWEIQVDDRLICLEAKEHQICLQRGHKEACHRLVLDRLGKEQVHIDLSFNDDSPAILLVKMYYVDY